MTDSRLVPAQTCPSCGAGSIEMTLRSPPSEARADAMHAVEYPLNVPVSRTVRGWRSKTKACHRRPTSSSTLAKETIPCSCQPPTDRS